MLSRNLKLSLHLVPLILLLLNITGFSLTAQVEDAGRRAPANIYRPASGRIVMPADSTGSHSTSFSSDTTSFSVDPMNMVHQRYLDSITRAEFIRDSLLAREVFIRDSIAHRKRVLDSLKLLKQLLPPVLEAVVKTGSDDIIISRKDPEILFDSLLGECTFTLMPVSLDQAYIPWERRFDLSGPDISFTVDTNSGKITSLKSTVFSGSIKYSRDRSIIVLEGKSSILNKASGRVYKVPVDSVFLGKNQKILKIKRYHRYHQVNANYRMGNLLFQHLAQVKQYQFTQGGISALEITNFCDSEGASSPRKVCNIVSYNFQNEGNIYKVIRKQNPENRYADGTFVYEYDADLTLKSVAFNNLSNSENWKTFVEVNDDGYVSRYVYQKNGWVHQTLLIHYYHNNPKAPHQVEKVTCVFEDDGVSYYQKNNTTGKSRSRDKMTGEWGPWQ